MKRCKLHRILNQRACADVIVFLVDAANTDRLDEAREELNGILKNDRLAQVPVLVLGNKIDRYALPQLTCTCGKA